MKNPLNNIKQAAEHIRLSDNEKQIMRAQIFERIDASRRATQARAPRRSSWMVLSMRYVSFAMVVLVLVGSTTTYAAQGSVPGGALYPVKIYVNESIQSALAVSPEAKVSYHTNVAQERLKEAESLASQGKLDANVSAQLEANFEIHVALADTIAMNLEETNPASAVEARVTLDSSLAAHSDILERIGSESDDDATKENSNSIAIKVRSRGGGAVIALKAGAPQMETMSLMVAEDTVDPASSTGNADVSARSMAKATATATAEQSTSTQKKIATQLQKKANNQVEDTRDIYDGAKRSLAATTSAKIKAQISALEKRVAQGKKEIKENQYDVARETFSAVIHDAVELSAFIEASKKYKQDFIRSWWVGKDDEDEDEKEGKGSVQGTTTIEVTPTIPQPSTTPKSDDKNKNKQGEDSEDSVKLEVHL